MKAISVVLFDLGDVACHFVPDRRLAALALRTGLREEAIHEALWESSFSERADRGEFSSSEMYEEIRARLGAEMPNEEIRSLWVQAFQVNAEVIAIARSIPNKYATGLLTNNPPILLEALADHLPEISETFNPILFSCELGATKPDRKLFAAAARRLAVDPEHIVLIDDSERNVTAARQHGWNAIRFLSPEKLIRDLELVLG